MAADTRSPLESQPVEILDQILENIPDPSDLLALSFASPIVASVVIPHHLPICRLDVGNLALLQQLSRSHLRRQVTALDIISPAGYSTQISLYHHRGEGTGTALRLPNTRVVKNPDPPDPWVPISPVVDHAKVYHTPGRYWHFARGARVTFPGPTRTVDDPLAETIDALRVLTRLTHLENFIVFHAHSELDVLVDPVVRQLAAALPRLTFVEVYITTGLAPEEETGELLSDGSTWLGIQRDAGGVCIGWNVIAEADEERLQLDYRLWGSLKWILDEAPHYNDPRDRM